MAGVIKLSSPATGEFWEVPVLFEDEHLLTLDKPAGLLTAPDPEAPERPSLIELVRARRPGYLTNAHRLDFELSGAIILVKTKESLTALAAQFSTDQPRRTYAALARGSAAEDAFSTDVKLGPHPLQAGIVRVDSREGKRSRTDFSVRERFDGYVLLDCKPVPDRLHQVQAHLKHLRLPPVGDSMYGGRPLLLSTLKSDYRLKPGHTERPLIGRPALHAERVEIDHPAGGAKLTIDAPWPKEFTVSVKYLRRYASGTVSQ